jgi:hypothetical protein
VLEVVDVALLLLVVRRVVSQLLDGPVVQLLDLLVSIEDGSDGLQRRLSESLDQVEVDEDDLEEQEDTVDDVVLPLDGTEGDGVDVLVEDEGDVDGQVHDDQTLGSDSEGQDLDGVGDEQRGHGQVVEGVVLRGREDRSFLAKVQVRQGRSKGNSR